MNEDLITAISREYAEDVYKNSHKETEVLPNAYRTAINLFAEDMENKLKWLSRRFCLVEKNIVIDAYKQALETNEQGHKTGAYVLCTIGSAQKVLLESLYPEIRKELR